MSDEQQRRGDAARDGSEPDDTRRLEPDDTRPFEPDDTRPFEPDDTRPFEPFGDDENHPGGDPRSGDARVSDRTEPMPRTSADHPPSVPGAGPVGSDPTRPMPRTGADGTQVLPPVGTDDPTVVTPRPAPRDATSVMPAVGREDDWAAAPGSVWAARAEVRPPRPGTDVTQEEWAVPPASEPRGRWWMPIVVGILVLVLLALLGWGIWLILQATNSGDNQAPAPAVSTSAAAPETTEPTTATATTEPTTTPTTTEPTGPAEVTVPALKGLSSAEARQALARKGLAYRLRFVTSPAPAGTVIDSDPAEGRQVPADTTVTLIVSVQPSSSPTPSTTPPTDTGDQPGVD
jgi:PASTA domain